MKKHPARVQRAADKKHGGRQPRDTRTAASHDRRSAASGPPRRVVIVCYDGVELLDVAGPANVFTLASRQAEGAYQVELVASRAGAVRTAGGVELVARRSFDQVKGAIDTLIVPGSTNALDPATQAVCPHVSRFARRARRVAGVCAGAFLIAQAGLLEGRRAVTHWAGCDLFEKHYPGSRVERDAIFVRDGNIWTSAGVTAGIDLALALVEQDLGSAAALTCARWLVVYLRRPGGQSQFSAPLAAQAAEREPISDLAEWMHAHLGDDLSVPALAQRCALSPRHFTRIFTAETGMTPAAWVQQMRLDAARSALETTRRSVKEVAVACGFGSAENLHRAFRRALGATPLEYRARFGSASTQKRPRGSALNEPRAPSG